MKLDEWEEVDYVDRVQLVYGRRGEHNDSWRLGGVQRVPRCVCGRLRVRMIDEMKGEMGEVSLAGGACVLEGWKC